MVNNWTVKEKRRLERMESLYLRKSKHPIKKANRLSTGLLRGLSKCLIRRCRRRHFLRYQSSRRRPIAVLLVQQ